MFQSRLKSLIFSTTRRCFSNGKSQEKRFVLNIYRNGESAAPTIRVEAAPPKSPLPVNGELSSLAIALQRANSWIVRGTIAYIVARTLMFEYLGSSIENGGNFIPSALVSLSELTTEETRKSTLYNELTFSLLKSVCGLAGFVCFHDVVPAIIRSNLIDHLISSFLTLEQVAHSGFLTKAELKKRSKYLLALMDSVLYTRDPRISEHFSKHPKFKELVLILLDLGEHREEDARVFRILTGLTYPGESPRTGRMVSQHFVGSPLARMLDRVVNHRNSMSEHGLEMLKNVLVNLFIGDKSESILRQTIDSLPIDPSAHPVAVSKQLTPLFMTGEASKRISRSQGVGCIICISRYAAKKAGQKMPSTVHIDVSDIGPPSMIFGIAPLPALLEQKNQQFLLDDAEYNELTNKGANGLFPCMILSSLFLSPTWSVLAGNALAVVYMNHVMQAGLRKQRHGQRYFHVEIEDVENFFPFVRTVVFPVLMLYAYRIPYFPIIMANNPEYFAFEHHLLRHLFGR